MCRMLNLVNTTTIEEIELYIEVVRVKAQVNQYVDGHVDLLVRDNYNCNTPKYTLAVFVMFRVFCKHKLNFRKLNAKIKKLRYP